MKVNHQTYSTWRNHCKWKIIISQVTGEFSSKFETLFLCNQYGVVFKFCTALLFSMYIWTYYNSTVPHYSDLYQSWVWCLQCQRGGHWKCGLQLYHQLRKNRLQSMDEYHIGEWLRWLLEPWPTLLLPHHQNFYINLHNKLSKRNYCKQYNG